MDTTQHISTVNPFETNQQAELDKRATDTLLRKIDLRLLPLLTLLYFFNYLDRISIGHADSFGLKNDLKLSTPEYKWAVKILYIPYVLFTIPSTLLMRRFTPSRWTAGLMFIWGFTIILMMLAYNLPSLLIVRFFLGMAEAGFVPGVIFYLSLWYIRKDQAFRMGIFMSGPAFAGVFDGILAYTIRQIDDRKHLTNWQWLCLVEGLPTMFLAIVTCKLLTDPKTVQWLDQCEKDILTTRLLADIEVIGDAENESLPDQIRSVCLDWKVLFYIFIYMGATVPVYTINSFLPSIIEDMLHTNATDPITELLTVPPYVPSCLTIIITSWNAGRLNERSNHIMILLLIQIIGFLYLTLAEKKLYVGAMIVGTGMLSINALTLSWLTNNIGGKTKRAIATALVVAFTGIGAIISEQIYREPDDVLHNQGHWIVIGILCFTFILVLLLKLLLNTLKKLKDDIKAGLTPLRGVDIGGWLVIEHWMTSTSPAWNGVPTDVANGGEYQAMKYLDHNKGDNQFKQHRDTFITEEDFRDIGAAKLNTVRIPIGYWIVGFDNQPGGDPDGWKIYTPNAIDYLDRAIYEWAPKYNITVLVDLHAAKGSQNGNDNSSPEYPGHTYWSQYPENVRNSLDAVEWLAKRYNNATAFLGIGLINEPAGTTSIQILKQYYIDAYNRIRNISDCLLSVAPLLYEQSPYAGDWANFMRPPQYTNVVHEWHRYQIWGFEGWDPDRLINYAQNQLKTDIVSWKGNPLYIGEWCLAASATSPNFTDDQLRQYAQVQMDTFQSATAGWTYWTWKFYNDDGSRNPWSMKDMINRGFIRL